MEKVFGVENYEDNNNVPYKIQIKLSNYKITFSFMKTIEDKNIIYEKILGYQEIIQSSKSLQKYKSITELFDLFKQSLTSKSLEIKEEINNKIFTNWNFFVNLHTLELGMQLIKTDKTFIEFLNYPTLYSEEKNEKIEKLEKENANLKLTIKKIQKRIKILEDDNNFNKYLWTRHFDYKDFINNNQPQPQIQPESQPELLSFPQQQPIIENKIIECSSIGSFENINSINSANKVINLPENNESCEKILNTCILSNHSNNIKNIILLNDNRLASCSEDSSIIIYDKNNFEIDIKINEAHNNTVNFINKLEYSNDLIDTSDKTIIISCSKEVKIWEIYNNKNLYKLIICIEDRLKKNILKIISLVGNKFAYLNEDIFICIYDSINYNQLYLTKEKSIKTIYQISNGQLIFADSENKLLKFVEVDKFNILYTLDDIDVYSLNGIYETSNKKLICGSIDGFYIIDVLDKCEMFMKVSSCNLFTCCTELLDKWILCGTERGVIFLYDNSFKLIQIKNAHNAKINGLCYYNDKKQIFSCGEDNKINIYDYNY